MGELVSERVTVLPPAGRAEMLARMIHGTDPKTGKVLERRKDALGRRIAKQRALPLRRVRARRRVVYVAR